MSTYGEVDFIVLALSGRVLLIEQRSGFLSEPEDGLVKSYASKHKHVAGQMMRNVSSLINRLGHAGRRLLIEYLQFCPDYLVQRPALAGLEPARIADASR